MSHRMSRNKLYQKETVLGVKTGTQIVFITSRRRGGDGLRIDGRIYGDTDGRTEET